MRGCGGILMAVLCGFTPSWSAAAADSIDSSVVQVRLPGEDATLLYVEAKGGFTVKLETEHSSIEARKLYLGDGEVAVLLEAHPLNGPYFQGAALNQGFVFKKNATIPLKLGYKKASELPPGSVYVILPGVTFEAPKAKQPTIDDLLQ